MDLILHMKKTRLFVFSIAALPLLSTAWAVDPMTLRTSGHFLEGVWVGETSFISNVPTAATTSSATLTANLDDGYKVDGWYSVGSASIFPTTIGSWTKEAGSVDTCTLFKSGSYYVALDIGYVKYGIRLVNAPGANPVAFTNDLTVVDSIVLPKPSELEGYEFENWEAENGVAYSAELEITPGDDIGLAHSDTNFTLTAQWTPHTMSISYDLDGGSSGESHPAIATYGTAFKVSAPTKTAAGRPLRYRQNPDCSAETRISLRAFLLTAEPVPTSSPP